MKNHSKEETDTNRKVSALDHKRRQFFMLKTSMQRKYMPCRKVVPSQEGNTTNPCSWQMKDHGKNSKVSFPPSFERLLSQKCIHPKTKELKNYLSGPSIWGGEGQPADKHQLVRANQYTDEN